MDPVEALNRIFPDEESFNTNFDTARAYAEQCKQSLAYDLANRPNIEDIKANAVAAPGQLSLLVSDTHKIQSLGSETLEKVKKVTYEINRLDTTKDNLTSTMRLLRQLKMLTKLYIQQDSLLKERRYEDMAESVKAASDLIEYFRPFRPLPQISQLSHEIGEMESKIYAQIQDDFSTALAADTGNNETKASSGTPNQAASPLPSDALRAACNVLDSLDIAHGKPISRQRLIEWYCNRMLNEYWKIYAPGDEAGSLENVKRRYTYLKNKILLRYMGFHVYFFPPEWPVRSQLLELACQGTVRDILSQVNKLRSTDSDSIQTLLSTIHETLEFEKFAKVEARISTELMPYLSLWVDFQDRQLHQRISTYAKMLIPPEDNDGVIPSSKELINVYRALLTQLSKFKHEEQTVQLLAEVMAGRLGQYATHVLAAYLPPLIKNSQDIKIAGKVESTADYIISTTLQLEKNISTQLSNSEESEAMFEKLALSRYRKVSIRVEDAMVNYLQRVFEPIWIEYGAQYSALHGKEIDVSRVSPYTSKVIHQIDNSLTEIFHSAPSPSIVYTVGTRVIDLVCIGFLTMAMARVAKPLSESQVEQMLLDLGAIKSQSLLHIVDRAPQEIHDKKGTARLERLPQRVLDGLTQAEAVLKVLMTPTEPSETFVRNYQLLVKDCSTLNFRKMLDVKGVRYQPRAIETFKFMASQEPHLIPENPLLRQIPTVPPPSVFSMYENSMHNSMNSAGNLSNSSSSFGINNFKRIGDFLRREHQ